MVSLLIKIFEKRIAREGTDTDGSRTRRMQGTVCSVVGICFNLILAVGKYVLGVISHSVALCTDGINNLTDGGGSLVMMLGFAISGKKADKEHPYGHARSEYIAGFVVALLILIMGLEQLKMAIDQIRMPEPVESGTIAVVCMIVAIAVKFYMFLYNSRVGKRIGSSAMRATALDSACDMVATSAVVLSLILSRYFDFNFDGWCGLLVAVYILKQGIDAARYAMSPLLGSAPDPELVEKVRNIVMSHDMMLGMHDIVIHDYGPGRLMVSLHGEVPADGDLVELHEIIDHIEREIEETCHCKALIHMDPIKVNDRRTDKTKLLVEQTLAAISKDISIHDYRIREDGDKTYIYFDAEIPADCPLKDEDVLAELEEAVRGINDKYEPVIMLDRDFLS